jgi:hypothetical protein
MKHGAASAAVLVSIALLAACGGGGTSTSTPAAAGGTATSPAPAADRRLSSPCSLVTRHDASRAFGTRAAAPRETAVTCTYTAGAHLLTVTASRATADLQRTARAPILAGQRRMSGAGYTGVARTFVKAGGRGAQSGSYLLKGADRPDSHPQADRLRHGRGDPPLADSHEEGCFDTASTPSSRVGTPTST